MGVSLDTKHRARTGSREVGWRREIGGVVATSGTGTSRWRQGRQEAGLESLDSLVQLHRLGYKPGGGSRRPHCDGRVAVAV